MGSLQQEELKTQKVFQWEGSYKKSWLFSTIKQKYHRVFIPNGFLRIQAKYFQIYGTSNPIISSSKTAD